MRIKFEMSFFFLIRNMDVIMNSEVLIIDFFIFFFFKLERLHLTVWTFLFHFLGWYSFRSYVKFNYAENSLCSIFSIERNTEIKQWVKSIKLKRTKNRCTWVGTLGRKVRMVRNIGTVRNSFVRKYCSRWQNSFHPLQVQARTLLKKIYNKKKNGQISISTYGKKTKMVTLQKFWAIPNRRAGVTLNLPILEVPP